MRVLVSLVEKNLVLRGTDHASIQTMLRSSSENGNAYVHTRSQSQLVFTIEPAIRSGYLTSQWSQLTYPR